MGLGVLIDGKWVSERDQEDEQGKFIRPSTTFRHKITADGASGFKAESGRYHLYISWACPWANRTAILHSLKGLEEAIGLSVVAPEIDQNSWEFSDQSGCIPDTVNNTDYLWEVYLKADPKYSGRVTVPVLWDKQTSTIVNNESREIMRMFDTEFDAFAQKNVSFYPKDLAEVVDKTIDAIYQPINNGVYAAGFATSQAATEFDAFAQKNVSFYPKDLAEVVDKTIDAIYQPINNGVYAAGFATSQAAYDQAVTELFAALDYWEGVLEKQRYLCGDRITEADWCMFTTLFRFDAVYYVHFKCNLRRIIDYPNLWSYLKDLYQQPGVKETCNMDQIKRHYYKSHPKVNPTRIVPKGPILNFEAPHNRYRMGAAVTV